MNIKDNLQNIYNELEPYKATLVAVSKTHPAELIREAYEAGHRVFGENRVQELVPKQETLPKDIQWHLIGHLQSNKVKFIAPFISLIHSIDSLKLLKEVNKEATRSDKTIDCLLQIYIAKEETKFGLSFQEAEQLIAAEDFRELKNIRITGLMGMATLTNDKTRISNEFKSLKTFFDHLRSGIQQPHFTILSMGMSSDYKIALEQGSNMVRIGTAVFGQRNQL